MKKSQSNFFWVSYSDLMTSLFFIMLTLYVLTVALLKYEQKATEHQLKKIKEIQNATKDLDPKYFEYQDQYKRFSLKRQVNFGAGEASIPESDKDDLIAVGKSIVKLIDNLKVKYSSDNIKYLIVIEGMASKDSYALNDGLSFNRALALKQFWESKRIKLDPSICELIIAGSGEGGVGRYPMKQNRLNQRFLIQIIPKIGKIEDL